MNNAASIIFIIFLGSLIFFSHGCNVKLNITNGTEKKFQLQVTVLSIKYKGKHLRFKRKKPPNYWMYVSFNNLLFNNESKI